MKKRWDGLLEVATGKLVLGKGVANSEGSNRGESPANRTLLADEPLELLSLLSELLSGLSRVDKSLLVSLSVVVYSARE